MLCVKQISLFHNVGVGQTVGKNINAMFDLTLAPNLVIQKDLFFGALF